MNNPHCYFKALKQWPPPPLPQPLFFSKILRKDYHGDGDKTRLGPRKKKNIALFVKYGNNYWLKG